VKRAAFSVLFAAFAIASGPAFADSILTTLTRTLWTSGAFRTFPSHLPVQKDFAPAGALPVPKLQPELLSIQPVPLADALSFNRAIEESA
jgi:hypothetical protein